MLTTYGEQLRYQEVVSTAPMSLPVHRAAVKLHARLGLDVNDEDAMLDSYIREATRAVEQDGGRSLVMQTRKTYIDRFPSTAYGDENIEDIEIRGCPVAAVDSVTYVDNAGATQVWSSASYQVNAADEPARLRYVWGGMWPTARQQEKSICVTAKCGYAIPFTAVASTDVLTWRGYTPVNGDVYRLSNSGGALPGGLSVDTDYYVVNASGSTSKLSLTAGGSAVDITDTGNGIHFLGEISPLAVQAIMLRVALNYVDREGAEYQKCRDGYWSRIYSLRYEGV